MCETITLCYHFTHYQPETKVLQPSCQPIFIPIMILVRTGDSFPAGGRIWNNLSILVSTRGLNTNTATSFSLSLWMFMPPRSKGHSFFRVFQFLTVKSELKSCLIFLEIKLHSWSLLILAFGSLILSIWGRRIVILWD